MAYRPVFEAMEQAPYFKKLDIEFTFYNGFSFQQRQRCIRSLHESYKEVTGNDKVLEVSMTVESLPKDPPTYIFDWLYVNALHQNPELAEEVIKYTAFTDIEFNPGKQKTCQAEAAAMYVGLKNSGNLAEALKDKDAFRKVVFGKHKG